MRKTILSIAATTAAFFACMSTTSIVSVAEAGNADRALSVSFSYGTFSVTDTDRPHGAVLSVSHDRGLSDLVPVFLHVAVEGGGFTDGDRASWIGGGLVGVEALISDASTYVVWTSLSGGALAVGGDGLDTDLVPRVELALGVDMLRSPTFSWGAQLSAEVAMPADLDQTSLLTAGLRITWRNDPF